MFLDSPPHNSSCSWSTSYILLHVHACSRIGGVPQRITHFLLARLLIDMLDSYEPRLGSVVLLEFLNQFEEAEKIVISLVYFGGV